MRLKYLFWVKNIMRPHNFYFPSIDYIMNLQEVSNLLNIDFTAMELQSGFKKLSKNQYYSTPFNFVVKLTNGDVHPHGDRQGERHKWMVVSSHQAVIILLQQHIWHFHNQGYAGTNICGTIKLFHQIYISYGQGLVIDHINHRKTDNRFENLKVCTYKQNSRNMKKRAETLTTGVCVQLCGSCNYVVSYINSNEKQLKKYYNVDKFGAEECMRQAIQQRKEWEREFHYSSS